MPSPLANRRGVRQRGCHEHRAPGRLPRDRDEDATRILQEGAWAWSRPKPARRCRTFQLRPTTILSPRFVMEAGDVVVVKAVLTWAPGTGQMNSFCSDVGIQYPGHLRRHVPVQQPPSWFAAAPRPPAAIGIRAGPSRSTYVHGHELPGRPQAHQVDHRQADRFSTRLIEQSSQAYHEADDEVGRQSPSRKGSASSWTSLGKPRWVVDKVARRRGGLVYHDVVDAFWAAKAIDGGCGRPSSRVNKPARVGNAGGRNRLSSSLNRSRHSGNRSSRPAALVPPPEFVPPDANSATPRSSSARASSRPQNARRARRTRKAILDADEDDIVLTERLNRRPPWR